MAIRGGGNARRDELHEQYWYFGVSTVTFCAHLQAKEAGVHRVHRPFRVPAARIQGGKDTTMKIALYYEDKIHPTVLEVPEEECTVMVEADYQERLNAAEDKNAVQRRTAQEILDAEVNAPTFRRNRTETRRHIHLSADDLDRQMADTMPDVPTALLGADYSKLHHAIAQLRPQQRELLRRVFWEGVRQSEIARQEGVLESTISERMRRIYQRLKKFLPDEKIFL